MITSLVNDRIKSIRKLQERKARDESGLFFLEGVRVVAEAVQQGAELDTLVYAPDLLKSTFALDLIAQQHAAGATILEVSSEVFRRLSQKEGPQGIAAVARQRWLDLDAVSFPLRLDLASNTWVALDSVADPGNLGAIMRTHDAVGGQGIILLDQSTDPYDPSAARASMGALFTQSLVKTSFERFREWKVRTGMMVVGTSGAAEIDYTRCRYPKQVILLMGSERQGLQDHHLALCDTVVSIPMVGASDSLNLAVATGVVLYEIFNQRREQI